jgi:hypothetical protein
VTVHAQWVHVRWQLGEASVDTTAFDAAMRRAVERELVGDWDDGRGRDMWYTARRGRAERELRRRCVAMIGAEPAEASVGP